MSDSNDRPSNKEGSTQLKKSKVNPKRVNVYNETDSEREARYLENDNRRSSVLESLFERLLWGSRYFVILAVVAAVFISFGLFIVGTMDIIGVLSDLWAYYVLGNHDIDVHVVSIGTTIGAIDTYLIAVVLLLFGFGLYELFISRIDPARTSETSNILDIRSLEQLKSRLAQVIIMALIIKFFQMVLTMKFTGIVELAILAGSVLALGLTVFLITLPTRSKRGQVEPIHPQRRSEKAVTPDSIDKEDDQED